MSNLTMVKQMPIAKFEFQMKRALVSRDSIDEVEASDLFDDLAAYCRNDNAQIAADILRRASEFEWSWGNSDGDPSEILIDPQDISFLCDSSNSLFSVSLIGDDLFVSASVTFEAQIKKGIKPKDIRNWLEENSAYACGYIFSGWSYSSTDGDNVTLISTS